MLAGGKEYGDCARKGWIGLCGYVDADGNVREICVGTVQNQERGILFEPSACRRRLARSGAGVVVRLGAGSKNERPPDRQRFPGTKNQCEWGLAYPAMPVISSPQPAHCPQPTRRDPAGSVKVSPRPELRPVAVVHQYGNSSRNVILQVRGLATFGFHQRLERR